MDEPEQRIRHLAHEPPASLLLNQNLTDHGHDLDVDRQERLIRLKTESDHPCWLGPADTNQGGAGRPGHRISNPRQMGPQQLSFDARRFFQKITRKFPAPVAGKSPIADLMNLAGLRTVASHVGLNSLSDRAQGLSNQVSYVRQDGRLSGKSFDGVPGQIRQWAPAIRWSRGLDQTRFFLYRQQA